MHDRILISRRGLIGAACSLAAAPILSPVSLAAMPGDNRFVTIVLRGAMDGLDLVQPYEDMAFRSMRPKLSRTPDSGLIDLDGRFGLHPAAAALEPLYRRGELGFVHAVSTPYRDGRSHFDGQDMLEGGGTAKDSSEGGWLNRVLSLTRDPAPAIDVSVTREIILSGPNPAEVWAPRSDVALADDELQMLARLYRNDPDYAKALSDAVGIDQFTDLLRGEALEDRHGAAAAKLAGSMLRDKYRIASFSINGWDTHVNQRAQFQAAAKILSSAIVTLRTELGDAAWSKTAVLAVTEFGRSAHENASGGTDHGTGGCAIIAGGALRGGKVYGRFPGLGDGDLLDGRDLMPTGDVRHVAAALLGSQFGIASGALRGTVFPGLQDEGRVAFL
ncbi:MAG: DUF1501 domain-containing protein [Rhizobium sp.]|nr:DUF1501 domain-containing protein [Rhizobium sp.]